ncbi:hematopoietic prostaglandin D synthase isoform X2 [Petaurus breviceps papuanus]|uniref:hematopoietic prostaglandin D synthase isoform X2 n=1 Tax=Petaurus breviceps papuanus TaxID=3040969 RepID=UPI0036D98B06
MPHYKLIYFNMRGRAEIIRYLFAYLNIQYEDHRISQDDWPAVKQTIPFGKIPILEVDGVPLHQSLAIGRFLAREAGLAGKTKLEQCQVDAIIDTLDDFMSRFPWAEKKQEIKVTWADFYWDICSTTLLVLKHDLLDKHPKLVALRKKVQSIPVIAEWIKQRPETRM